MINKSMKIIPKDRIRTTTKVPMINYLKCRLTHHQPDQCGDLTPQTRHRTDARADGWTSVQRRGGRGDKQTDKQADKQKHRQIDTSTDKQTSG